MRSHHQASMAFEMLSSIDNPGERIYIIEKAMHLSRIGIGWTWTNAVKHLVNDMTRVRSS